jgi:hypothetical protein
VNKPKEEEEEEVAGSGSEEGMSGGEEPTAT